MVVSWRDYLAFAVETAWQAGQMTLGYFQTGLRPELKADESPVTVADQGAEQLIRQRLADAYPRHAVVGEEYGEAAGSGGFRWFIDPIDGTRSFVRGVPLYAVLLALEVDGVIEVGAAYFPALGEMLAAATGEGCWWNGRRAHVSAVDSWREAIISFTDAPAFATYQRAAAWDRLQACGATVRGWSDAYGHLLVATGRAEVMLDPIMSPWDCGPFPVILREAGGYFGDWQGNSTIYAQEGLSCNAALRERVLALVAG
jgi:histidinol-phosphatase